MTPQTGEQGDGNSVGSASAGAPSLGEGAASETAGIGSADARAGDQRDAYLAMIRQRIEENRTYPSAARRRREEGMVTLAISIDGQGNLSQIEIITGAGSFHLDRAAKRMVEKSAPFPAPPVTPFATRIPIVFALN
ncbi:MAG: energy transducer TonB [Rhodobiaceae bacterium]|nr:energy transducer TonB [Rhodobiaceae bacterium]